MFSIANQKTVKCELCGSLMIYDGLGEYLCPDCNHNQLDDFGKVRKYLEINPGSTQADVSKQTGVSMGTIRQFLHEGRVVQINAEKYIN